MQGDAASPRHWLTSSPLGESVSPVRSQRILLKLQLKGFPVALILSLGLVPFSVPVCPLDGDTSGQAMSNSVHLPLPPPPRHWHTHSTGAP